MDLNPLDVLSGKVETAIKWLVGSRAEFKTSRLNLKAGLDPFCVSGIVETDIGLPDLLAYLFTTVESVRVLTLEGSVGLLVAGSEDDTQESFSMSFSCRTAVRTAETKSDSLELAKLKKSLIGSSSPRNNPLGAILFSPEVS